MSVSPWAFGDIEGAFDKVGCENLSIVMMSLLENIRTLFSFVCHKL